MSCRARRHTASRHWAGSSRCALPPHVGCMYPPIEVEFWLLLEHPWEVWPPRLWVLATVEELLCKSQPHRAGLASLGIWCPPCPSLEWVTHGGDEVVIHCDLKLSPWYTSFWAKWEVHTKVCHHLCPAQDHLSRATDWLADDCYLCWAGRCPGEAKLWTKAGCCLCQAWDHLARGMGMQRPAATCLRDFRKVGSMSQGRPFV